VHPCAHFEKIWLKRTLGASAWNLSVLMAGGINREGYRCQWTRSFTQLSDRKIYAPEEQAW